MAYQNNQNNQNNQGREKSERGEEEIPDRAPPFLPFELLQCRESANSNSSTYGYDAILSKQSKQHF
jgi:hypothetical protein